MAQANSASHERHLWHPDSGQLKDAKTSVGSIGQHLYIFSVEAAGVAATRSSVIMEPSAEPSLLPSDETVDALEPVTTPPTPTTLARTVADRLIHFLGHASNETLGACLVGLGAGTYLILGRVGLLLIGVCGGVVLHAHLGPDSTLKEADTARRKETGLDIAKRVLDWRERSRTTLEADLGLNEEEKPNSFAGFGKETSDALNALTDATIRDYVRWWYSPIIPTDNTFPTTARRTLTSFLLGVSSNIARKRPADAFLEFATNTSSIFIVILSELSVAVSASPNAAAEDAVKTYLRLKPDCSLGNLMDRDHQKKKLMLIADDILDGYLDSEVYRCTPARVFLRQILAETCMEVTIDRCCKAEWINDWIAYLLEEGEPEIMKEIDAGVGASSGPSAAAAKVDDAAHAAQAAKAETNSGRQRTSSRAEEAMEEAMREARRLTELMAEEDARRIHEEQPIKAQDDASDSTPTHIIDTPTSSQDDLAENPQPSGENEDADDAIANAETPVAETNGTAKAPDHFTLHKAGITLFDDGGPIDRRPIKSKPIIDYLIQVEPVTSTMQGWMIPRTYPDFETLHEVLRRIAAITGIDFAQMHSTVPAWRGQTKEQLREALERYLIDAINHEQLAESEGMKRFLEKDRGLTKAAGKGGFWPTPAAFESMGKGMLDVLVKAPKGVAGGGKAVIGGVSTAITGGSQMAAKRLTAQSRPKSIPSPKSAHDQAVASSESLPTVQSPIAALPDSEKSSTSMRSSSSSVRVSSGEVERSASAAAEVEDDELNLPPPPSDMPADYESPILKPPRRPTISRHTSHASVDVSSADGTSFFDVPSSPAVKSPLMNVTQAARNAQHKSTSGTSSPVASPIKAPSQTPPVLPKRQSKSKAPLNEQETQMTIELLFAIITELYTLSSAWQIRRTLLTAAKTFLLRPGNPQLENIRALLQGSVLDANSSDAGIATQIRKLRENTLPTEAELAMWPAPLDAVEKEALRVKARRLFVAKGVPAALVSVMGAAASGEALGKVFDCLQVEEVARGLMFGVMMQGTRALTQ